MRIRVWIASLLLGRTGVMEQEVQMVYKDIWPKHEFYKEDTLKTLRAAYLKWTLTRTKEDEERCAVVIADGEVVGAESPSEDKQE